MLTQQRRLLIGASGLHLVPFVMPSPPEGPAPPSNAVATADSPFQVDLVWVSNSGPNTTFHIRRGLGVGPGPTDPLADVSDNNTTYSDFTVEPNTQYFYTIWASNPDGASSITISNSVTTPSESATLTPDFYNPSGNIIEGQGYDLRARVLNPDQTIHTNYVVGQWTFDITAGASFGSIGGPNSDILTLNAGSAGNLITIQATYQGPESLNPDSQGRQFTINQQPPGGWPNNEPGGMTHIVTIDGSTKDWPVLTVIGPNWNNEDWVRVISDSDSKYGQVVEKAWYVGNGPGWHGHRATGTFQGGHWEEVYTRMVFEFSSNWQWHTAGGKFWYTRAFNSTSFGNTVHMWHGNGTMRAVVRAVIGGINKGEWLANGIPIISRGVYHTIEVHHRADIVPGTGFYRTWYDGNLVPSWRHISDPAYPNVVFENMDWQASASNGDPSGGIGGIEAPLFWGGSGQTKMVNDYFRLSELYISARNKQ